MKSELRRNNRKPRPSTCAEAAHRAELERLRRTSAVERIQQALDLARLGSLIERPAGGAAR
jgi:hypothetical protein